ncbi:MAG TPA: GDSL-type esterase/lipase family protein [Anaeromyxobacter sp.]|nr:GDSL-type esterase/lipase family protein [Anaeromyxobacter sp.]
MKTSSRIALALRIAAVALVAAALAAAPAALARRPRKPTSVPRPAAAAVPKLAPAPLVSRGKRVASRPKGGEVVVDGVYRTSKAWSGGKPSPRRPSWIAIEIGTGYSRLLLSWTSSGNHDYLDRKYGAPVDYRIETSGDSTDGEDGTWRCVADVTDNPARSRAHAIDFAGQRWVRMSVTRLSPDVFEWGLFLDEIDVHDLSRGGDDVWVFFGDSITSGVFDRAPDHQPSFAEAIARLHPGYFPATVGAGFGRLHHSEAVTRIDEVLALNPDAKVVALSFGSNDWDPAAFRRDLVEVVRKVRAAGKIPIVPRIPFRSDAKVDFPARLDAVVDEVTREERLLPGPDLYAYFRAHPERLQDGLHPDPAGAVEMIRMWAEAVGPLYR